MTTQPIPHAPACAPRLFVGLPGSQQLPTPPYDPAMFAAADAESGRAGREAGPAQDSARLPSILVVEDEDPVRNALVQMIRDLSSIGDVVGVDSGEAAVAELSGAARPYTFALIDLNLPGMSGLATLDEIEKSDPRVGVYLMTSEGDCAEARAAEARGLKVYDKWSLTLDFIGTLFGGVDEEAG